jgi:flavin reductase (DIM6/NTAB) family NADH-FMN oxidoreductase RutF
MGVHQNWLQRQIFFASSYAIVTSRNVDETWNVRPYQLALPYRVDGTPQVILSTQVGSRTFRNIKRAGWCVFNYIEHNEDELDTISFLGNHFNNHEDRDARVPWTVGSDGIIEEAFQSMVCTYTSETTTDIAAYVVMDIAEFNSPNVEDPLMSTTYGLRGRHHIFAPAPISRKVELEIPENSNAFAKIMAARAARSVDKA